VANQYCGALGKNANCQVATTVHLASDTASCPVNWRLFVPARWDPASDKAMVDVQARRCAAAIPDDQRHRPSWQLALQAIDEMLAWALPAPKVITADSAFGDNAEFRFALSGRGLPTRCRSAATWSCCPNTPDAPATARHPPVLP